MDVQETILEIIRNAAVLPPGERQLVHLQENAYRLSGADGDYFIKWVAQDDENGCNEIKVNRGALAEASLATPRLLHVLEVAGGRVACWEWLEGVDLRFQSRELLAQAFRELGRFHAEQRYEGDVAGPTTRGRYPTVGEMLAAEMAVLCAGLDAPTCARCEACFDLLGAYGYVTLIHGDMHPGNLRLTESGLMLVDWGFALHSLNVFDLDYVQSVELTGDREWWDITPQEALAVLPAYCQGSGMDAGVIWDVQRAVMAWSQLHSRYNARRNGNEAGARRCEENLSRLIR